MKQFFVLSLLYLLFNPVFAQKYTEKFVDHKAFSSGKGKITQVCYSKDGTLFASGNSKGMILVRDSKADKITHILQEHKSSILSLNFHPSGKYLASTSKDGSILVWDLTTSLTILNFKAVMSRKKSERPHYSFALFSPEGNDLYYGGSDGNLMVIKPFEANASPKTLSTYDQGLSCAAQSTTGKFVAMGTNLSIKIVDVWNKKVTKVIKACDGLVLDIHFNKQGTQLGSLCQDGTFTLWDVASGKQIHSLSLTASGFNSEFAFSPDGKYLVVGNAKSSPKVWDLATWQVNSELSGHQGAVGTVDFKHDSKAILTGGHDQMVKIWQWKRELLDEDLPEPKEEPKEDETVVEVPVPTPAPAPNRLFSKAKPAEKKKEKLPITAELPSPFKSSKLQKKNEKPAPRKKIATYRPPAKLAEEVEGLQLEYTSGNVPQKLGKRRVKSSKKSIVRKNKVRLQIWDSEYVDGDTISLLFNGEWILQGYPLQKKRKEIEVTLSKTGDNRLLLYAHNEGTRPPNTAAVIIDDGRKPRSIQLQSDMNNCDSVQLRYVE